MSNSWDEMRKAKEDSYFDKKNRESLEKLSRKDDTAPRPSPITGEPMEQLEIDGVIVDRCKTTGGIWLDAGELEQIIEKKLHAQGVDHSESWFDSLLQAVKKI